MRIRTSTTHRSTAARATAGRLRLRTPAIVLAVIATAGILIASSASAAGSVAATSAGSPPALSLPSPTGPYHVGTLAVPVADPSRGGETMVQLFYPTLVTRGRSAAYLTPKTTVLTAAALHVPAELIARIITHAFSATQAAPGRHPVVLFSPGLTELRSDDTALDEDLASRGYVVVAVDHPHESAVVEFPGGRVIRGSFRDSSNQATSTRLRAAAVRARVRDIAAVVRALPSIERGGLLRGRLDLPRIGMFGFSIGGATADEAMRALPQIRAGVDLDGSLYGRSLDTPLDRPFLLLARDHHSTATDPSWRQGWAMLRGYRREIRLIGAGHGNFTDLADFLQEFEPSYTDPTGYYGSIPADRGTAATREVLSAFFDHFLRGRHEADAILNDPAGTNRELVRLK
jgi:dienelactone hydrolase